MKSKVATLEDAARFVGVAPSTLNQYWRTGKVLAADGARPVQFYYSDLRPLRDKLMPGCTERFFSLQSRTGLSNNIFSMVFGLTDPTSISHWKTNGSGERYRPPNGPTMQKMNMLCSSSIGVALNMILDAIRQCKYSEFEHGDKDKMEKSVEAAISRNQYLCHGVGYKKRESEPKPEPAQSVAAKRKSRVANRLPKEMCNNIEHWMRVNGRAIPLVARSIECSSSALGSWLRQAHISMPSLEKVEKFCRDNDIEMTGHLVTSRLTFMPEKKDVSIDEPKDDGRSKIDIEEIEEDNFDGLDLIEEVDEDEEEEEEEEKETFDDTLVRLGIEFSKAKVAVEHAKVVMKHAKDAMTKHVASA